MSSSDKSEYRFTEIYADLDNLSRIDSIRVEPKKNRLLGSERDSDFINEYREGNGPIAGYNNQTIYLNQNERISLMGKALKTLAEGLHETGTLNRDFKRNNTWNQQNKEFNLMLEFEQASRMGSIKEVASYLVSETPDNIGVNTLSGEDLDQALPKGRKMDFEGYETEMGGLSGENKSYVI